MAISTAYLADIFGKLNDLNVELQGTKITQWLKKLEFIVKDIDNNQIKSLPVLEEFIENTNISLDMQLKESNKKSL